MEAIWNTCLYEPALSSSLCHHWHVCGAGGAGVEERSSSRREADPFLQQVSMEASCRWADGIATEARAKHKAFATRPKAQMTKLGTCLAAVHHHSSLPRRCAGVPLKLLRFRKIWAPQTSASHRFSHIDTYPTSKHLNESRFNSLSYPQHTKFTSSWVVKLLMQ